MKNIKNYRLIAKLIATIIFLGGCTHSRYLEFSQVQLLEPKSGGSVVSVIGVNFEFNIDNSAWPSTVEEGTKKRMSDYLAARLREDGLRTTESGPTNYSVNGSVNVKETLTYNSWMVPSMIVGIGLFPIGVLFSILMPTNDMVHQVVANIVVIESSSNSEILRKQYNESTNFTENRTHASLGRMDRDLSDLAERTIGKIAIDVADTIKKSRPDSAAPIGTEGNKPSPTPPDELSPSSVPL